MRPDGDDSYQTARMRRLIWIFAGRTCPFSGFQVYWYFMDRATEKVPLEQMCKEA